MIQIRGRNEKKCPVCGASNPYSEYTEECYGVVEIHYHCSYCYYFEEGAYGPIYKGIVEGYPKQYTDIVKDLNLSVFTEAEFEKIQISLEI